MKVEERFQDVCSSDDAKAVGDDTGSSEFSCHDYLGLVCAHFRSMEGLEFSGDLLGESTTEVAEEADESPEFVLWLGPTMS